jgi:hypothetical protein
MVARLVSAVATSGGPRPSVCSNRPSAQTEGLGARVVVSSEVEPREVVERDADVDMLRPERPLVDREGNVARDVEAY